MLLLCLKEVKIGTQENFAIKGINLLWFKIYRENRKQFIQETYQAPLTKA